MTATDPSGVAELFAERGISVLRLNPGPDGSPAADELKQRLLIRRHDRDRALEILEARPWRYSWARSGWMRLVPMACYWWDGGREVELYWGAPLAPMPSIASGGLTTALWRSAEAVAGGVSVPDPTTRLVLHAIEAHRPGEAGRAAFERFRQLRSSVIDAGPARLVAREAGVAAGFDRAIAALDGGAAVRRPGRPFDRPAAAIAWRVASTAQRFALPRRIRRVLTGSPRLGDATIRGRFRGIEVLAGPGVFVPTPDADLFIDEALAVLADVAAPTVIEVGAGCGAIALGIAAARPDAEVYAADVDASASMWARRNARRLGVADRVDVLRGSLLGPFPGRLAGKVDLVIANLPFYPPRAAATIGSIPRDTIEGSGDDGLQLVRTMLAQARPMLRPAGCVLLQMFAWQWELMGQELVASGFGPHQPRSSGPFAIGVAERKT